MIQARVYNHDLLIYSTWENFGEVRGQFAKIFLTNIHTLPKMYLEYALTVAYSANFPHQIYLYTCVLLPVWFAKIFHHQIFPVYGTHAYK